MSYLSKLFHLHQNGIKNVPGTRNREFGMVYKKSFDMFNTQQLESNLIAACRER